ncbi:TRAP transporter small permease [Zobellella aerophila]|uniref:TRAP transporter small permease protein n=1 Tax=Zobellella aerophila TaxID=870480 RepID=A0ABP6W383_9GAMM
MRMLEENIKTEAPAGGWLNTIECWLNRVFSSLTVVLLLALCGVVLLQVTARLLLPSSPAWTEELSRYLFIYVVAFGIGVAYQQGELVSVELFQSRLRGLSRPLYRMLISLLMLGFCVLMFKPALAFSAIGEFQTSPTLFIKMQFMFVSTLLVFVNLFAYILLDLLRCLQALFKGEV